MHRPENRIHGQSIAQMNAGMPKRAAHAGFSTERDGTAAMMAKPITPALGVSYEYSDELE